MTLGHILRRTDWIADEALAESVYSVLASTNQIVPEIWRRLPEIERERFRRVWQVMWNHVRVPVPPSNRARIDRAIEAGRLVHLKGLRSIAPCTEGFRIETAGAPLITDWVVNASGFGRRPRGDLFHNLLRSGHARENAHGGIEVSFDTCEVLGRPCGARLFAVGHPTIGDYFAVSNIDVIQLQVRRVVAAIEQAVSLPGPRGQDAGPRVSARAS